MKDFSRLPLKISYDSGRDDVLDDFYIPVLSEANQYDRIAGFFSSSVLALAARGLGNFILNGGNMRLVTCPRLQGRDIKAINDACNTIDKVLYSDFITSYNEIEDKFELDHVKALGWMIAKRFLEIKIAVIRKNGILCSESEINELGIMHQKVGILYDQTGNIISFSGSNNESSSGWLGNTEEFKVFCSWKGATPYISEDIEKFNSFWTGSREDVDVIDLPTAIKEKLVAESADFEPSFFSRHKYPKKGRGYIMPQVHKEKLKLFYYQEEAVKKWEENNRKILLEMATGTGKTRTAIGCMNKVLMEHSKLLVVIACPQVTLAAQWEEDISKLDLPITMTLSINGNVQGWGQKLNKEIFKLSAGRYKNLVIFTTHQICSSSKFLDIINYSGFSRIEKMLIGDEVHGMGANKTQKGLSLVYNYRLGLSATPQRWFDDEGSKLIADYFGKDSYQFSIKDALENFNPLTGKTFLVNYYYHPCFVSLSDDELERYKELTEKIIRMGRYADDDNTFLEMLRFQRANIEKSAVNKYEKLIEILDELGNDLTDTIIFVSDSQIDKVLRILGDRGITATRFTQNQGTVPMERYGGKSERDYIKDLFISKKYQVLVAIKCLDEGIDIPSADTAIVMASSTNPREYVQRIGRVIRQAPGKDVANIYDMILRPDLSAFKDEKMLECERRIFEKEMIRVEDLSRHSLNNVSVLNMLYKIKEGVLI